MLKERNILLLSLAIASTLSYGQINEMTAYVPSSSPARTADDVRIGFLDATVPGFLDITLPKGTHRIDLLNARGKVKQSHEVMDLEQLDLRILRKGTWTLRAHTPTGMVIRRFMVQGHGSVLWEAPRTRRVKER